MAAAPSAGDLLNLVLGACAVGYSYMPADRVKSHKRGVALAMRAVGVIMLGLAAASLSLRWFSGR